MIDLHCHLLYGMDDGADSIHESIKMIENAAANNIDVIIATPHYTDYSKTEEFVAERNAQVENLMNIVAERNLNVVIGSGAEVYLDSNIFTADNLDRLAINSSRYLLCEYSLKPFDEALAIVYAEEVINRGYIPVIAHPERYIAFLNEPYVINELYDMGCLFQVNASSLAGHGGERMQHFALSLVKRGFVKIIATDAHSSVKRNNNILEKVRDFPDEITKENIDFMTNTVPLKIIKNEPIKKDEVEYFD